VAVKIKWCRKLTETTSITVDEFMECICVGIVLIAPATDHHHVVVGSGSVGSSGTIVEEEAATPSCSGINFVFEQFTLEFILPRRLMCSFNTINNNNKSRLVKWSRNANNGGKTNNNKHPSS
jgi:hypothetical protein